MAFYSVDHPAIIIEARPDGWRKIIPACETLRAPLAPKEVLEQIRRVRVAPEGTKATLPDEEIDTGCFSPFHLRIAGDGCYAGKRG